jgi:putative aminopeptidase FrvX
VLLKLLETPGPSGAEQDAAAVWREAASAFADVSGDHAGNSVARVKGTGDGPLLAVFGHLDEIGLIVRHIDDDGRLWFRGVGGWMPEVLLAQRLEILTRDGVVPGVVYARRDPARREDKRAVQIKDLFVDVGAKSADEARERVRLGARRGSERDRRLRARRRPGARARPRPRSRDVRAAARDGGVGGDSVRRRGHDRQVEHGRRRRLSEPRGRAHRGGLDPDQVLP